MDGAGHDEQAFEVWSRMHHGLDPRSSGWISGWVRMMYAGARLAIRAGLSATAVTMLGLLLSIFVPVLAAVGGGWALLACVVLVAASALDGVDGAVAGLTGTASAWGEVLDSTVDRILDLLLISALVLLGAPLWLGISLAAVSLLLEQVRTTARGAGMKGPGVLTLWERPQRVIMGGFGTGLVGLESLARGAGIDILSAIDGPVLATAAAGIGMFFAVIGLATLLIVVRRALRSVG